MSGHLDESESMLLEKPSRAARLPQSARPRSQAGAVCLALT